MNLVNSSLSIVKTLRYLEWSFLTVHILMCLDIYSFDTTPKHFWLMPFFVVAFVVLSWIYPVNRPYWQRQAYIFLGLFLAVVANFMNISFDMVVFVYIAKSCFLLNRKSILPIVAITGIAWVTSDIRDTIETLKLTQQQLEFQPPYGFKSGNIGDIVISAGGVYLAGCIFVILFSSVVIAEKKSRQQTEILAEQVETLAAALERNRIARDMHDSLGHTLTDLNLQLEIAQKFRLRNLEQAFQAVDMAKILASQCIEDVSQTLQAMRQSDFDLDRSLKTLFEQVRQKQSLQVYWEGKLPQLSLQTNHQIYCIIKEALINVQKHARASCVRFRSQSTTEAIILELEDDGIGFDPQDNQGFGLKGMAERVQAIGGKLKISSAPGQGTQIYINIPYD
jgi:signal transduction histidine kinase